MASSSSPRLFCNVVFGNWDNPGKTSSFVEAHAAKLRTSACYVDGSKGRGRVRGSGKKGRREKEGERESEGVRFLSSFSHSPPPPPSSSSHSHVSWLSGLHRRPPGQFLLFFLLPPTLQLLVFLLPPSLSADWHTCCACRVV